MAIPIIGAPKAQEKPRASELITSVGRDPGKSPLPPIEADLPPPGTAPEGKRPLSDDQIRALLSHPVPIVRGYAVEQASRLPGDAWAEAIRPLIADPSETVAADAIHAMEVKKYKPAVDAIAERYKSGTGGEVVAVAASALGELAPDRLLDAVGHRGRLDNEAYAATATALARSGSSEVVDFLAKALNRAGALTPERRGALYGAALLSGSTDLSNRVISLALADSKNDEPEGGSFPSRSALAAVGGLSLQYSRKAAGLELYDHLRGALEADVLPILREPAKSALEAAMAAKRSAAVLEALAPVLEMERAQADAGAMSSEYGNIPLRRRGLLRALIGRKDEIGQLELKGSAVFLAAAVQAATVILVGEGNEETSPAMVSLAKALEMSAGPAKLAAMSGAELLELFLSKSEHQMRRVLGVITHDDFHHSSTLRRFTDAIVKAGHGPALFEAAAEVEDPRIHQAVIGSLAEAPAIGEPVVLEALTRTPLEAKLARLALTATEEIRTERIALAIGRRFTELRQASRGGLVRAVLRLGDPRLVPVIEQRAWPDEPEELAWTILSLVHQTPESEKLARARERLEKGGPAEEMQAPQIRLPLHCKRCGEVLTYGFERVLLDIDAKDQLGDPAFVGPLVCKACGSEEQLEPTQEAARILTAHMLEFLDETQRGQLTAPPLVAPAQTEYKGKRVGFLAALRALDREIETSPGAIRPRLHRARLRLLLKRLHVDKDVAAVLEADPKSPEGLSLKGALLRRDGDIQGALALAIDAHRLLSATPPARLYEADDPAVFMRSLEDYLLDLERDGAGTLPEDIDLSAARNRRAVREAELERMRAEMAAQARAAAAGPAGAAAENDEEKEARGSAALAEAFQRAGRNDPCPCGSGKKFKKCHGRGR